MEFIFCQYMLDLLISDSERRRVEGRLVGCVFQFQTSNRKEAKKHRNSKKKNVSTHFSKKVYSIYQMETHILLFFIALFCLIVYLARILIFIIFTGKLSFTSLSRKNASKKRRAPKQSSRREKKSEKRVTKTRRSKVVDKK